MMIRVKVYKDGTSVSKVDLEKDEIILGRERDADVQLFAAAVSRRHARLQRVGEGWQIADLGAANGVFLSKDGAEPERVVIADIAPGDKIHIEAFVIVFENVTADSAPLSSTDVDDFLENSLETKRTQFISMHDVLKQPGIAHTTGSISLPNIPAVSMNLSGPATAAPGPGVTSTAPTSEPKASASTGNAAVWWVHLTSPDGHDRVFELQQPHAAVGSGSHCDVVLPTGPASIVELDRTGKTVNLVRVNKWPFPRVSVDGAVVKEALLMDRDSFVVGKLELAVHLNEKPSS